MSRTSNTRLTATDRTARLHDMVWIPGGIFQMGSDDFYPEERRVHRVAVDGFWMDEHPVTNAEFRRFVDDLIHREVSLAPESGIANRMKKVCAHDRPGSHTKSQYLEVGP